MESNAVNTLVAKETLNADKMVIDASKIPALVEEQYGKLAKLDKQVGKAIKKAKSAEEAAEKAGNCKKGLFQKKAALQTISGAVEALSEANMNNAQGLSEAFKFMQSLAEINQGLFGLAAMSTAANNTVLQQLELKLKGASAEKLSALARSELNRTISILKNQGNVLAEQDKQKKRLEAMQLRLNALSNEGEQHDAEQDIRLDAGEKKDAEHDDRLDVGEQKDAEHDRRLDEGEQHDARQDELLKQHSQTDQEHAQMIAANIAHDAQQDELLEQHSQTDQEHAQMIAANMEHDAQQDGLIAQNMEHDAQQDQQLAQHAEKDAEHDRLIAELREENQVLRANMDDLRSLVEKKAGKELSSASIAISIIALILVGIQFFL